jgi:hypothetical protein
LQAVSRLWESPELLRSGQFGPQQVQCMDVHCALAAHAPGVQANRATPPANSTITSAAEMK